MAARDTYHHGELREALVAHAFEAVRAGGTFSLRAAARSASVDVAAVYRHFKNKDALLAAVAEEAFGRLAQAMTDAQQGAKSAADRYRAIGRAYVRFAADEPRLFRVAFGPESSGGSAPYQMLLDVLAALKAEGGVRDPLVQATLPAWSAVHGLAHLIVDGGLDGEAALPAADLVIENVLRGLRG